MNPRSPTSPGFAEHLPKGPLAVSRAIRPDVRNYLLGLDGCYELPCLRGRTVVPDTCRDIVAVGYPNHLGVFDPVERDRMIALTGAWSRLRRAPEEAAVIVVEESVSEAVAGRALAEMRRLVKRLRQLRGIQVAIRPQSPVIVALLPSPPGTRLLAVAGVTALGEDLPEYPGGVRIEPPADATASGLTRYAADVEGLIMEVA